MIKGNWINGICKYKNTVRLLGVTVASIVSVSFCMSNFAMPLEDVSVYKGKTVYASDESMDEVRTINLGTSAISNPKEISANTSAWGAGEGNYIYYGEYYMDSIIDKAPIKWRVLSVDSDSTGNTSGVADSILMATDNIIDVIPFNSEIKENQGVVYKINGAKKVTTIKANNYAYSDVKYWLNSKTSSEYYNNIGSILSSGAKGFLDSAFSQNEILGIKDTYKSASLVGDIYDAGINKDKIFLLSSFEANNPKYGFSYSNSTLDYNISRRLEYTTYAKIRVLGISQPTYQLRTVDNTKSNYIHYVYEGSIVTNKLDDRFSGVVPAMNLDKEKVVYVTKAGFEKKDNSKEFVLARRYCY